MAVRELPKYVSKTNYLYVTDVDKFVQELLTNPPELLSCDTETFYDESLKAPHAICKWIKGGKNNRPFGVSFYTGAQGYWVDKDLELLKPLLESSITKTFHNAKVFGVVKFLS